MAETASPRGAIIGIIMGTVAAVAGGLAFGFLASKNVSLVAQPSVAQAKAQAIRPSEVRPIAPIVTNLREPSNLYVRLEAVVVLEPDTPDPAALAAKIGDDLMSYLRTVSASQLEGPTGFQYVRGDLKRRSVQLGGGKVRELLLQSFVIQ